MDGARGEVGRAVAPWGSHPLERRTDRPKSNRLSRSFRQKQAVECESPKSQQSDFKTPTRILRSRPVRGSFSEESPHNDSDIQLDIVWDATSPSPRRLGKRGKKHAAAAMNISEIVRRIAPKHGRPEVSEPTLQQWIRDIATLPCTPDVQVPRPRKKPQRPSGLDDLLKLAQRFDLNMFRQDEEENDDDEEEEEEEVEEHQMSPELLSDDALEAEVRDESTAACPPAAQLDLDQHMDDDLDFLFDGPTQCLSGNISQAPSQVKPSAKPPASAAPSSQRPLAAADFEDDWENDDLLNDSLLLEMTQNPLNLVAPKHCSTQKPAGGDHVGPEGALKREHEPDSRVNRQTRTSWEFNSSPATVKPEPRTFLRSSSPASHTTQSFQTKQQQQQPVVLVSHHQAAPDFTDEDLDSFFSSEPAWDDPADDFLLCEMCEDLENQIQEATGPSAATTRPPGPTTTQRSALQPVNRIPEPLPQKLNTASSARTQTGSGPPGVSACLQASSRVQQHTSKNQFRFKKPIKPVMSSVSSYAVAQCSAAEIELKKQQAMERRRQRLQAQNLQPSRVHPT